MTSRANDRTRVRQKSIVDSSIMPSKKYMYEVRVPTFLLLTQDNYSFSGKQKEKEKVQKVQVEYKKYTGGYWVGMGAR